MKRATTPEERQAIYRFRYSVYVEELGRELGGADHTKKTVSDDDDEMDFSIHLYTGDLDALTGSVRVRAWVPGQIPDEDFELLSMELFPDIRNQAVSELGRLMIRPTMRGKLVLPSLARAVYETAVEKGCDLSFCYCAPGLVQHYRKLGFRPYAAPLVPTVDGMHVGLVAVLSDASYLRRMSSPVTGLVKKYYGPGKRRPFKLESLGDVLDLQAAPVEMQPERIWHEVQQEFLHEERDTPSFLEALSESSVKLMTRKGFIINVKQGTLVTKEGYGEREMFIILDGVFEVLSSNGRRLAVMDKGDLFGEIAFFRSDGKRSASVRAASDGRVLVVRRRFLDELEKSDPSVALQILFNLGRIQADRLVKNERLGRLSALETEE